MDQQFSLQTEFKPPTDPISDSEFVPPTKSIDEQEPGPIGRFFSAINTPLVNITPEMQRAMQSYQEQHPILGTIGNFGTGMMTAASSPLGLGLGALTGGANLAEQAGMTTTARLLHTPGQIGALGMGAHGLYNFANQPTLAGKTEGLLEAGLGGLGAYGLRGNIDKVAPIESLKYENPNLEWRPPIKITKEPLGLKSAPFISGEQGTTQGNQNFNLGIGINNDVPPEIAAQYGIQAGKTRLPNEFSAVGNEQTGRPQFADPNKKALDIARDKFNMGRELPADQIKDVFSDIDFDEPQFARSEKGGIKIGQNIKRSAAEVTTGYSQPLQAIMIREGMQNAIDAVKHLNEYGKINVKIAYDHFEIVDNGRGMNRQQLETVFSDLYESGKTSEANATGGKGIGKATYILGGKNFSAETVVQQGNHKVKYTIAEGTPDEFAKHVPVTEEIVPKDTPTGTKIRTTFKDDQDAWEARDMLDRILERTRNFKGKVSVDKHGNGSENQRLINTDDKIIGKTTLGSNDVSVGIPKDSELADRSNIRVDYLNNGMYQFSDYHYLDKTTPYMPNNLIVDIHPHAEEGTSEYPFPTQRESIKSDLKKSIQEYIDEKLVRPQQQTRQSKLIELYQSMATIPVKGNIRKSVLFDPGDRLTPEETHIFKNSSVVTNLTRIYDKTLDTILKDVGNQKWSDRLEGVGLVLDNGMYGVHIPNPTTGKSTILVNPFLHMDKSSPEDAAFDSIITTLHEGAHIGIETPTEYNIPITDSNDSRIGKFMQSYIEQTLTHGGLNIGHGVNFLKRLGEIYAKFGPAKSFSAADQIHSEITDNSGGYNAEVQRLLQIYQDSRGRAATTEDFLSGTGDKSKLTGERTGNILSNDSANGIGTSDEINEPLFERVDPKKKKPIKQEDDPAEKERQQIAITKLTDALKNAGTLRTEQESLYSEERAKRIARVQSVTKIDSNTGQIRNPGLRGFYQQLGHLRGELPKVDFSRTPLSQKDVNTLIDTITNSKVLLPWEEIRAKIGLLKLISAKREELPQRNELALLGKVFGPQFDQIIQMHGGLGGPMAKKALVEIIGSSKAIMASIDLSAPLRQGLPLIHRREWWNAIGPMIKSFGDKDYFDALQKSLEERPNYLLGKAAGLKLTEISDNLSLREEQYSSTLASKIPLVKHSERAYVGFLNKLRADTFDSLIENAEDLNLSTFTRTLTNDMIPTKLGKEIARFVNNATGRGSLNFSKVPRGKGNFEKIAPELNSIFFSPRLIASRLTILNPNYYIKASPFVRKEAIKSLLAIAGFGLTTNSLLAVMGGKTNTQLSDNKGTFPSIPGLPTNADFMKNKFGNTRIDPYSDFQSYIVTAGRLLSGETTSSNTGKTTALGKDYASHTHKDVVEDFVANKLSPIASLIYVLSKDKDFEGNPIDVKKEIMSRFIPMFLQDLHDIYVDDPSHLPLGLGAVFGMGTQTYKASQKPAFNLRLR